MLSAIAGFIGFQFHKVRLKAKLGDTLGSVPNAFQFHKVRLKARRSARAVEAKVVSIPQGTIKSQTKLLSSRLRMTVSIPQGTIKSMK